MKTDNRKIDLVKNTALLGFGKFSTFFMTFLILPFITRSLTPGEYGLVDLLSTYAIFLAPLLTLQTEMAVFRLLIDARTSKSEIQGIISAVIRILYSKTLPIVLLLLILGIVLQVPHLPYIAVYTGLLIIVSVLAQISRGLGRNTLFMIASIVDVTTYALTALLLVVLLNGGVEGLLLAMVLSQTARGLLLFIQLKLWRYVRSIRSGDRNLDKEMLTYSIPLIPNTIAWWVINMSNRTVLTAAIGTAANGIYAAASQFGNVFSNVFSVFQMALMESASLHIDSKDKDKYFTDILRFAVRFFGFGVVVGVATIPFVFNMIVGEEFRDAYQYIPLIAANACVGSVMGIYSAIYVAKKLTRQIASTTIVAACINLVLVICFVGGLGIYAAALATLFAFLFMAIYRYFDIQKYVRVRFEARILVILAVVYAGVCWAYYIGTPQFLLAGLIISIAVFLFMNRNLFSVLSRLVGRRAR